MTHRGVLLIGVTFVVGLLPVLTMAVPYPGADPCQYIAARCGTSTAGVVNMIVKGIETIATFLAVGGGALAVVYSVIGGFQMLLSFGDEGKFNRGRSSVTWALVGFGLMLGSQVIANFIYDRATIAAGATAPLIGLMEVVVSTIVGLLNTFFVLIVMFAGVRAVIGRGKTEEFTSAKHAVGFAIAGAIVVNLARALAVATFNVLG